jgi:uncharacterized RDD family membrane protein YckC
MGAHTAAVEAREDDGRAVEENRPLREVGAAARDDPAPPLPPLEETDEGALERGIDLVIGATARGVRMASLATDAGRRAIEAVGSQPAGRATTRAVNALTEPLAREGAAVRAQLEDDMPVAARNLSARVVPAVIETIDPDNLLDAIDLDAVLAKIDLEALLETLDLNALLARVDMDALLARIDVDVLLDRIDVEKIIDRVDVDGIVERVDVGRIIARVDVDGIIDRVDVDKIIGRVDIEKLIERVDVDSLVGRTEIGGLIAKSTSGVLTHALDAIRRQGVSLDNVIAGGTKRAMRRGGEALPEGPALLVGAPAPADPAEAAAPTTPTLVPAPEEATDAAAPRAVADADEAVSQQGHYAGALTRLVAFVCDWLTAGALFTLGVAFVRFVVETISLHHWSPGHYPVVLGALFVVWLFVWFAYPWSMSGKSLGMAVLGLRVVRADGSPLDPKHAALRTITLPLGFLTLGIGFLGILFGREHRALYDRIAGTAVVYDWDARAARYRFLARQHDAP